MSLALAGAPGGCASRVDRRRTTSEPIAPARNWDAILAPEEAAPDLGSRRNERLSERRLVAVTAADEWPHPARPSMERPLRIHFSASDRQFLFFRPEEASRGQPPVAWPFP